MQRAYCGLLALGLFLGVTEAAKAQPSFVYTTIAVPGSTDTQANGINTSGQIVGFYGGADLREHGFLLSGGNYTTLDPRANHAYGINDSAQIVGSASFTLDGFLLSGNNYTNYDFPGSSSTVGRGINASGQIVGSYSVDGGSGPFAFLLSGGNYTAIQPPDSESASANGINNRGDIVGFYSDINALGNIRGFVLSGGNYTKLHVPGSVNTFAYGINDAGQVVGYYGDGQSSHAFLYSGGTYTTIDVPGSGATFTYAYGINNAGQIVGAFDTPGGGSFLATPVSTLSWHGPSIVTTVVSGNPSLVQAIPGTYGTKGNYELVVGLQIGGIGHFYRNNDDPSLPWSGPFVFATDQGHVDAVSLIQSNFSSAGNGPGNLALVARIGNNLLYYYRDDVAFAWHGASIIATGVTGVPSFVQARPGTFGTKGNYELVVPLQGGGIGHFYRNNDDPSLPWSGPFTFGTELGVVDAVSLIQSNFSSAGNGPGNLAVAARIGNSLVYFYRDDLEPFAWHGPKPIFTGVAGNPSFVQAIPGTYGTTGNYELVVPLQTGGIGHFERNNDDPNLPWSGPVVFGTNPSGVDGVSLIQSNFSSAGNGPGNLAVVDVGGGELGYFYRDDLSGTR